MKDLGLSYEAAGHGIQSAIRFEMTQKGFLDKGILADAVKHLRVGLDMRAADMGGLLKLLVDKGVITDEEVSETMRLAANAELDRYEDHIRKTYGLPEGMNFR